MNKECIKNVSQCVQRIQSTDPNLLIRFNDGRICMENNEDFLSWLFQNDSLEILRSLKNSMSQGNLVPKILILQSLTLYIVYEKLDGIS